MQNGNEKFLMDVIHVSVTKGLCISLQIALENMQKLFGAGSDYQSLLGNAVLEIKKVESLITKAYAEIIAVENADTAGAKN